MYYEEKWLLNLARKKSTSAKRRKEILVALREARKEKEGRGGAIFGVYLAYKTQ